MEPAERRRDGGAPAGMAALGALLLTAASTWSVVEAVRADLVGAPLTPVVVTIALPLVVAGFGVARIRSGRRVVGLVVLATLAAAFLPAVPGYVATASLEWLPLVAVAGLGALLAGGAMAGVEVVRVATPRWRTGSSRRLVLGLGGGMLLAAGSLLPQVVPRDGALLPRGWDTLLSGGDPALLASLAIGVVVHLAAGVVVSWVVPRRIGAAVAGTLAVLTGGALTSNALAGSPGGADLGLGLGWFAGLAGAVLFVLVRPDEDEHAQVNSSSA